MSLLADNALKVAAILAIALALSAALHRRSAAVRHWLLSAAIVCALVAPLLGVIAPWHVHVPLLAPAGADRDPSAVTSTLAIREPSVPEPAEPTVQAVAPQTSGRSFTWAGVLGLVWLAGAGINLLMLGVGLLRLRRLTSHATTPAGDRWAALASTICRDIGLARDVHVLQSDDRMLLVTWGLLRPRVLLPALAVDWPDDRARVVLHHELTHVARGDWAFQMAAEILRALYWFNPLAWIACRRLRQESEYACDDAVLGGGIQGRDYAGHLVDLARAVNVERRAWLPAPAMARASSLEGRVKAMLNPHIDRRPLTAPWRAAILVALLAVAAPIVAAQGSFFTFSGAVVDQTNGILPGAVLTLTNPARQATYQVRTDDTGRFAFIGLPGGDYTLEIQQAGFAPLRDAVRVTRNAYRTLQLQVGSLEEAMTVASGSTQRAEPADSADSIDARRQRAQERSRKALEACRASVTGGSIVPPIPLVHVNPVYPEGSKALKMGGTVTMDAVVAADGTISDIRVLDPKGTDLENAAVDAVRQWQFSPTLLNCRPIDVNMKVTTNFVVRP